MPSTAPRQGDQAPLRGLRIIDLTSMVLGPYATQILADYGADVVKVEPPQGDLMRRGGASKSAGMGALYLQLNRNKRSIVLDIKQASGREALLRLCGGADVFVHNNRLAAMRRLALTDADVRKVNPRLIYVSLIGYGDNGPYAGKPAYDDLIQGICALPATAAQAGGQEPRYVPLTLTDRIVGINAAHAILAAVIRRDRVGEGQSVELPMFETMAQFVLGDHLGGRTFDPPIGGPGYNRLMTANRRPYATRDGYVCALTIPTNIGGHSSKPSATSTNILPTRACRITPHAPFTITKSTAWLPTSCEAERPRSGLRCLNIATFPARR